MNGDNLNLEQSQAQLQPVDTSLVKVFLPYLHISHEHDEYVQYKRVDTFKL